MLKCFKLSNALFVLAGLFLALSLAFAGNELPLNEQEHFYLDKTQLVTQQIDLLKKRLGQAKQELAYLEAQSQKGYVALPDDQANRFLLYKTGLQIASSRSSLDSINIELGDSQQALSWLEKAIQEIENQLNASNVFGLKLIQEDPDQLQSLRTELKYQGNLLQLEKSRANYLIDLQKSESQILQLYRDRYAQVNAYLKSLKLLHIKERQVKSELEFQQQQNYWLEQLDSLYAQIKDLDHKENQSQYLALEAEVFYANENINLVYLKTLIARYQDQMRQMRLTLSKSASIGLLNNFSDQAQVLAKQVTRVESLVNNRVDLLKKRRQIFVNERQIKLQSPSTGQVLPKTLQNTPAYNKLSVLEDSYQGLHNDLDRINKRLQDLRGLLERSVQHELSARQGLPGFSASAWLELGRDLQLFPTLTFKLVKGFTLSVVEGVQALGLTQGLFLFFSELLLAVGFLRLQKQLQKWRKTLFAEKPLLASFALHNLWSLASLMMTGLALHLLAVPGQQGDWLLYLMLVFLSFRAITILARENLLETLRDDHGYDVKLYRGLRIIFFSGALITGLTVLLHQLPLIYELKDLFDRLFLLVLMLASLLVVRFWRVLPELVIDYLNPEQNYLRRTIYFMGVFVPLLLFVNALLGLFGFVNLVWMIASYEGIFTAVLVGYFLLRGLLHEASEASSRLMISHLSNGWLWTEALLKPLHSVLQVFLFFGSWMLLFLFYGWDQQSPVVERLYKLLFYPLMQVMSTTITPITVLQLLFAIALFYWAARWTRELVYRLLQAKTQDMGIRNSISILSQYAVIVLGLMICLKVMGIDLHAFFLLGSGVLIAISFGLKDLMNNFVCGLLLLFERPLRVGDIVAVNGQEGKVLAIGSRAVTIRTWDHIDLIVPNTELFTKAFVNWTVKDDIVRTVISLKIDREDNPHEVQEVVMGVLKLDKNILSDPAPEVLMKDMMDSTTEFEVRYFINIRQVSSRVAVRSEVLFALWQAFSHHGIKAPNLQHHIMIKNQPLLLPEPPS